MGNEEFLTFGDFSGFLLILILPVENGIDKIIRDYDVNP